MGKHESASARVEGSPDAVFRRVTDVSKLPDWNAAITEVLEAPEQLSVGSVWKVRIHAMGRSWVSKSQVSALDPATHHFTYRSQSDDGNPSYADWDWRVEPSDGGSMVSLTVDLNPVTFWRKYLLVSIRRPALRKEMRASVAALGNATQA